MVTEEKIWMQLLHLAKTWKILTEQLHTHPHPHMHTHMHIHTHTQTTERAAQVEQFANIMDHKATSCIIFANIHHYTLTSYLPVKNKQQNYESILLAIEKQKAKQWKHFHTTAWEKKERKKLAYCDILCCVTFWLTDVDVLWYPVLLCHILADK